MERLIGVWVESLRVEALDGSTLRESLALLDALGVVCPFTELIHLGFYVLPSRGPSRFFGGEERVLEAVATVVRDVLGREASLGVADGLVWCEFAARDGVVVEPGKTDDYRRARPLSALGRRDLATTGRRLGLRTVGDFADLERARVSERFSASVLVLHRVARGELDELPGQRDARLGARLGRLREADRPDEQRGFFGQRGAADDRAHAAALRLRQRLGADGVVVAALRGGRLPQDRAALVPWGSPTAASQDDAPWPGQLRAPSPATVFAHRVAVELRGAANETVRVDARGMLNTIPTTFAFASGAVRAVTWYAGPWPLVERWWAVGRRRAQLQVLLETGEALLLVAESGRWSLAGVYD